MAVEQDQMDKMKILAIGLGCLLLAGCASAGRSNLPSEGLRQQMEAAHKVVGAMAPAKVPLEKYSPVTGKHYTGELEFEPGTGVKLVPVEE